jgi:hypothetical protein
MRMFSILDQTYRGLAPLEHNQAANIMTRIIQISNLLPDEASTPTVPTTSECLPIGHTHQNKIGTYKLDHGPEGAHFVVYWFLQDLLQLRVHVCTTWTEYKNER